MKSKIKIKIIFQLKKKEINGRKNRQGHFIFDLLMFPLKHLLNTVKAKTIVKEHY